MNQDLSRNRKLFYKGMDKVNGWEVQNCRKVGFGRNILLKRFGKSILNVYVVWIQKSRLVNNCGFEGGEQVSRAEVDVRLKGRRCLK